jgi:hypothetical protein
LGDYCRVAVALFKAARVIASNSAVWPQIVKLAVEVRYEVP